MDHMKIHFPSQTCINELGGFQNIKKSIFFAYLIIQYVYNTLLYGAGIDDSM